jgi:hypothetical protein
VALETAATILQQYGKDITLAVLGVLGGGIISFFFYRRSLLRDEISFACEYNRLIWSRIPAFSNIILAYQNVELHDPRQVLFFIWNSGNTTIEGTKITSADPLGLKAGNVRIINAAVLKSTRDVICAAAKLKDGDVEICFDYLDPGDGFVIETLYDVVNKEKGANNCPEISGTIKGLPAPVQRDVTFENRALKRFGQSTALLLSFAVSVPLLIFQIYEIAQTPSWLLVLPKILTAALLFLLAVGLMIALIFTLRSYRIPMKLKIEDNFPPTPGSYGDLVSHLEQGNQKLAAEVALLKQEAEIK